ncbi:poly [ADP-ribose] polymerase tankyrase [Exaiptasia diaphana]|uniref:Uncharacterized protein n=1 Tax=Exaiptasia diaphana TaxID=2652724 RepID=A0A913XJ38_EXADI|nr:poly [ADP-ribose] polymerase tankyrase [Exaiptasia diaphana]KXJ11654.1 putative ankyrin repeat protein [Exaiptasia diaphana]
MDRLLCRRLRDEPEEERVQLHETTTEEEEKANKAKKEKEDKLFKAFQENNIDEIATLIQNCDLNVKEVTEGRSKKNLLHSLAETTCKNPQEEEKVGQIFRCLVENGCSVNAKDKYGNTPLKLAAEKGNIPILKLLLEKGADVNKKDDLSGDTPLHWAAKNDKVKAVHTLLTSGFEDVDVNIQNDSLKTPLHLAVENKSKNVVLLLLYYKANPKQKNKDGEPPLRYAETNNLSDIEKLLKEPSETYSEEASLIKYAKENDYLEVVKLFEQPLEVECDGPGDPVASPRDSETAANIIYNTTYNITMRDHAQAAIGDGAKLINEPAQEEESPSREGEGSPSAPPEPTNTNIPSSSYPSPTAPPEDLLEQR